VNIPHLIVSPVPKKGIKKANKIKGISIVDRFRRIKIEIFARNVKQKIIKKYKTNEYQFESGVDTTTKRKRSIAAIL
jgi:hypothetical protein